MDRPPRFGPMLRHSRPLKKDGSYAGAARRAKPVERSSASFFIECLSERALYFAGGRSPGSAGGSGRECPGVSVATPTAGGSYGEGDAKSQEHGGVRSWDWVRSVEEARTGRVTQKCGTSSRGVSLPVVNFARTKPSSSLFCTNEANRVRDGPTTGDSTVSIPRGCKRLACGSA